MNWHPLLEALGSLHYLVDHVVEYSATSSIRISLPWIRQKERCGRLRTQSTLELDSLKIALWGRDPGQ